MSKAHPGFRAVQAKIAAKSDVSEKAAGAILANATRHASPAAKKANPNLRGGRPASVWKTLGRSFRRRETALHGGIQAACGVLQRLSSTRKWEQSINQSANGR